MKPAILPAVILLAVAGCSDGNDVGESEPEMGMEETGPGPAGMDGSLADGDISAEGEIPVALRGRWGMGAADCDPAEMANKGLMEVSPTTLKFYESLGTLGEASETGPMRIRASYDFEGEGMEWQREILLEGEAGGNALLLTEYGDDAAAEPRRYEKCS